MKIEKETVITVKTTDGEVMEVGNAYVFNTSNGCLAGVFNGISKYGALQFVGVIADTDVRFNVMPKSIKEIYEAYVQISTGSEEK